MELGFEGWNAGTNWNWMFIEDEQRARERTNFSSNCRRSAFCFDKEETILDRAIELSCLPTFVPTDPTFTKSNSIVL